ncbi:Insect cuticle protein [Homalodisca vitripennis]|nr:Insect cuticle protein [Homalodisca vitripennis]
MSRTNSAVICILLIDFPSQLYAFPSSTLPKLSDSTVDKIKWKSENKILKALTNRILRKVPESSYFQGQDDPLFRIDGLGDSLPSTISESANGVSSSQSDTYRPDGSFSYSYSLNNGISTDVEGYQKNVAEKQGQAMKGQFSYTSPEGTPIFTLWYADETGFHAEGSHLPAATLRNG